MKVQVVSDLHLEFGVSKEHYEAVVDTVADVLVIAGDLSSGHYLTEHLLKIQEDSGKMIVFVPGNHDYYHASRKTIDQELDKIKDINKSIHVLKERVLSFNGMFFIGSTGWWDGSNGHIGLTVKHGLNDFSHIYDLMDDGNLDGVKWGRESRLFFEKYIKFIKKNAPEDKIMCISHHYPHIKSLDPRFKGSPLNACFGNRWEHLIEDFQPDFWVHGHTHTSFDYMVGDTRVICNPQGYPLNQVYRRQHYEGPELENNKYRPDLVVEI